jgi:tetratricopeptide (TPR) repeat protein
MSLKPLAFVAMPFGRKWDADRRQEIDFDDLYARCIVPAANAAGVDVLRADEEVGGGFVHLALYERLLLAEIVIADVTLANANVFYELGIRHAARPRATIMLFCQDSALPFDVRPLRAIPYRLTDQGRVSDADAEPLIRRLTDKLQAALTEETPDSPLFQLIPNYPGITLPHEATETFRGRVRYVAAKRTEIETARHHSDRTTALRTLQQLQQEVLTGTPPPELLVYLLLAYRDLSAWDAMIALVDASPEPVRTNSTVREQYAWALNRRQHPGDRPRAIQELEKLVQTRGPNPETCGLLGRIYKDLYDEAAAAGDPRADSYLEQAIAWYRQGFEADPRDYYPGINLALLLVEQGTPTALQELACILPVVQFAVGRRGGLQASSPWDLATILHVAVLQGDGPVIERACRRFAAAATHRWMVETTLKDLRRLGKRFPAIDRDPTQVHTVIAQLEAVQAQLPG